MNFPRFVYNNQHCLCIGLDQRAISISTSMYRQVQQSHFHKFASPVACGQDSDEDLYNED